MEKIGNKQTSIKHNDNAFFIMWHFCSVIMLSVVAPTEWCWKTSYDHHEDEGSLTMKSQQQKKLWPLRRYGTHPLERRFRTIHVQWCNKHSCYTEVPDHAIVSIKRGLFTNPTMASLRRNAQLMNKNGDKRSINFFNDF